MLISPVFVRKGLDLRDSLKKVKLYGISTSGFSKNVLVKRRVCRMRRCRDATLKEKSPHKNKIDVLLPLATGNINVHS